jgi:hypothetical protein
VLKRLLVVATAAACIAGVMAPPVGAVDVADVRGIIQVDSDFAACGHVRFQTVQPIITGNFSGAGIVGANSTIRGTVPILAMNTDHVEVCIPGAGFEPAEGVATYILAATGASGDTSTVKTCIVNEDGNVPFQCVHI